MLCLNQSRSKQEYRGEGGYFLQAHTLIYEVHDLTLVRPNNFGWAQIVDEWWWMINCVTRNSTEIILSDIRHDALDQQLKSNSPCCQKSSYSVDRRCEYSEWTSSLGAGAGVGCIYVSTPFWWKMSRPSRCDGRETRRRTNKEIRGGNYRAELVFRGTPRVL